MLRDFIERKLFSLSIWCDQLGAVTEFWLFIIIFVLMLAGVTWIYFV